MMESWPALARLTGKLPGQVLGQGIISIELVGMKRSGPGINGVNAEKCLFLIKTTIQKENPFCQVQHIPIFQYSNIPVPSRRDRYRQSKVSLA
jgi:hypothetical protein